MAFAATWIQLEIIILTEISHKKKDKYPMFYMQNLKYGTNEPIYKIETDSQTYRTDVWLPRGKVEGSGMDGELGVCRCKL